MRTFGISRDLSVAINILEEILNHQDGEMVLETIKKYKQTKNPEDFNSLNFNND